MKDHRNNDTTATRATKRSKSEDTGEAKFVRADKPDAAAARLASVCFDWSQDSQDSDHNHMRSTLSNAAKAVPGGDEMLCIAGKCMISGCDIHALSLELDIMEHFATDAVVSKQLQVARSYWRRPQQAAIALLMFSDRIEILLLDGNRVEMTEGQK